MRRTRSVLLFNWASLLLCLVMALVGCGRRDPKLITVVFGGDVALSDEVARAIDNCGEAYVFEGIRDLLSQADVAAVNLEAPLTLSDRKAPKPTPPNLKEPIYLKAKPSAGKALLWGGIDVAFLANNHIGDYEGGVVDTVQNLRGLGILPVGAGENRRAAYEPTIVEVRGVKMAFLAFCDVYPTSYQAQKSRPGCAWAHPDVMRSTIAEAKKQADLVFVNLHFGGQGTFTPSERQKELAKVALDAGADMVVGNHPHVIQPVAVYKGRPVLFSLGNLVLAIPQYSWSIGLVARATIVEKSIRRVDLIPVQIVDLAQPRRIHGWYVLDHLYQMSKEFGDLPSIKEGYIEPKQ
ncbi:MAG: CapA family protein [Candidatus Coatesbacteria bacterium]|nr:CapA family protein [Candidatus Coatesbacteria bacterium]